MSSDTVDNKNNGTTIIKRKIKLTTDSSISNSSISNSSNSNSLIKDSESLMNKPIHEYKQEIKYINGKKCYTLPVPTELVRSEIPFNKRYRIGCAIMVKNESKCLSATLKSFLPYCDCLIAYDTGSTDNTIEIIKEESSIFKKPLFLISGSFVDFSTSRNVLLKYANDVADYLLLPDSNDILKGGENILPMILHNEKLHEYQKWNAVFVSQIWETTIHSNFNDQYIDSLDKDLVEKLKKNKRQRPFKNVRIIKTNVGWTYNSVIHENVYIQPEILYEGLSIPNNPNQPILNHNTTIIFFQNRDEDNIKSEQRYASDLVLLHREHENNPDDLRTIFYIGQTNECSKDFNQALEWYRKRAKMGRASEEKYLACYRTGKILYALNQWNESIEFLLLANVISIELFGEPRAEPLVIIGQNYLGQKMYHQAHYYSREACRLTFPKDVNLIMEREYYDELRWSLAIQIGIAVGEFYDVRYAIKNLAENIGCMFNENKIVFRGNEKDMQLKASELQKLLDICNKHIEENVIISNIKSEYEKKFEKYKTTMVFPIRPVVQWDSFKIAVASGKVKNISKMTTDGNLEPVQSNVPNNYNTLNMQNNSNITKNKKKKNKKKK
jgi:tetratricopeptide (TPR) repeat protein